MSFIVIDCSFIFDPNDSWASFGDWEKDFSKFLDSLGLEASKVLATGTSRQVLMISKKKEVTIPPVPIQPNQSQPIVKNIQTRPTLPKGE